MKRIIIIDASGAIHRFYHGMGQLSSSTGRETQATTGWINYLWRIQDLYGPAFLVPVFDTGKSLYRTGLLPTYKANRSEKPQGLTDQLEDCETITKLMGYPHMKRYGTEADDLASWMVEWWKRTGSGRTVGSIITPGVKEIFVVSADKDFAQLCGPFVKILKPDGSKFVEYNVATLTAKMGVRPNQVASLLALMGDKADNIEGAAGVGIKTACALLAEHQDLEGVIKAAETGRIKGDKVRQEIMLSAPRLRINLKLAQFRHDDISLEDLWEGPPDHQGATAKMLEWEMTSTVAIYKKRNGL